MGVRADQSQYTVEFNRITNQLRLLCVCLVVCTFPYNAPQALHIYAMLAIATLFTVLRSSRLLRRFKLLSSPASILVVDAVLVGLLIALIGNISTPYSGLFVFIVIIAGYQYQIKGVLAISLLEAGIVSLTALHPLTTPLELDATRTVIITATVLVTLGILVARLTYRDQEERTTLQRLQLESNQERSRLHTLVDSLNVAIFLTDASGRITQYNEAAKTLVGNDKDWEQKQFSDALVLHPRSNMGASINILKDGSSAQHRRDLSVVLADDSIADLDISVTPVQLDGDKTVEYIFVCEDITRERSLEEQRTEFISVASHELRTPLAIIEAALETALMSKDGLDPQVKMLVDQAHRNSQFLAGIIKDLTMLAEAKNDNLPIQLAQIDPTSLLDEIVKDFDAQAKQKGLLLQTTVDPATPSVLSTEHHVREVLQNYMTNAIKYSEKGSITVKAGPSKNNGILFSVADQGIGISPSDQKLLFTKFFRAEDYRTRTTGGTGLGLYLCMELAQRLGAKLWCESKVGHGSTFYLEIPPFSHLKRDQRDIVKAQVANLVDGL